MALLPKYSPKEEVYIQGKLSWCRLVKPNDWSKWSVTIHPNPKDLEVVRELQAEGLKNVIKKDDDGYYVQFSRPVNKETSKGKMLAFTAPTVVDKDGIPMDGFKVGNGSDGTVKLEVYQHGTPGGGRAKAARLVSVRVDNLVLFDPDTGFSDEEKENVSGLKDQPEQLF